MGYAYVYDIGALVCNKLLVIVVRLGVLLLCSAVGPVLFYVTYTDYLGIGKMVRASCVHRKYIAAANYTDLKHF